jgi:uncharacterized protein DUF1488
MSLPYGGFTTMLDPMQILSFAPRQHVRFGSKADMQCKTACPLYPIGKGFAISFIGATTLPSASWPSHDRRLAMPLQRGEVQGYDFNRMAVEFTMVNQGKVVPCSISTAAMDDLEGRRDVKSDQRIDQFMRLREIIEERASRKFFEEQAQADRPVVLRSNDFPS